MTAGTVPSLWMLAVRDDHVIQAVRALRFDLTRHHDERWLRC